MPASTKPVLPPLKTPQTATFPSEISHSPLHTCVADVIKREDGLKTPITPPAAYTDFLKALTPVLTSPNTLGPTSRSLSSSAESSCNPTPTSAPSTSSSFPLCRCDGHKSPSSSAPPPSPFVRAQSGLTPTSLRRLRIPQSPAFSPATQSPMSASMRSPFSPADWNLDSNGHRYFEMPRSAGVRPVSVRSVVTRTVTYKRTPLEPAPKGKKRKLNEPDMAPPTAATQTAVV